MNDRLPLRAAVKSFGARSVICPPAAAEAKLYDFWATLAVARAISANSEPQALARLSDISATWRNFSSSGRVFTHSPCIMHHIQSSPLIWSTDVRSTRLYGQFLAGPNIITLMVISNPDIKVSPLVWAIFIGQNADLTSGLDCILLFTVPIG